MRAAVLYGILDIRLEEVEVPSIRADQVLIRVRAVGICGSDIHYYKEGRIGSFVVEKPMILGHECSGEIVKVGEGVKGLITGDRVAIEPGFPCRRCGFCKTGRYNLCDQVKFYATPPINGAFCEYVAADADFVYKLPNNIAFEEGSLLEPLSIGIHASKLVGVSAGDNVVVLGAGPVGLCALEAVIAYGANPLAITDIRDHLLKCAKKLGVTETINVEEEDVTNKVKDLTQGEGVDIVIDAVGSTTTIHQAFDIVKKGGRIVIIGLSSEESPINTHKLIAKELTVKGLFRYANTYPTAINLVSSKKIDLKPLITHTFPLDQIRKALDIADKKADGAIKVIIMP